MSNPGVLYLSSANSRKYPPIRRFDIEDNIGESIHVHYDSVRVDLTIAEFLAFAGLCRECFMGLYAEGDSPAAISKLPGSFIKDFSDKLKNIKEIRTEKIRLGKLLCVNVYDEKYGLFNITPLKKSKLLKRIDDRRKDTQHFLFDGVLRDIRRKAVTTEDSRVYLLGELNVIRYGLLEALGLSMAFGADTEISVSRVVFDDSVRVRPARCPFSRLFRGLYKRFEASVKKRIGKCYIFLK